MDQINKMIEQLSNSDEKAGQIISELVNIGVRALPLLLNAIRNGPTQGHILLRQVILQINDSKMQEEMECLVDDENAYIRSIAYRVLGKSKKQIVVNKLEEYLKNDNLYESDRVWSAKALGDGMHFQSLPALREQLRILVEDDAIQFCPDLTLALSFAMAQLGDSSALPYVLELSKGDDITVRLSAFKFLRFFSGPGVFMVLKNALLEFDYEIKKYALDALSLLGTKNAAHQIWETCRDKSPIIAQYAKERLTKVTGLEVNDTELFGDFDKWIDEKGIGMNNGLCFRLGCPIDVPLLVKKISESKPSDDLLEELFVITGNRFGNDPEIWFYANQPNYKLAAISWLEEYEKKYSTGVLYKFGLPQNLDLILE